MKKKFAAILAIILMALLCLSSCIRERETITVNKDGTFSVSVLMAVNKESFKDLETMFGTDDPDSVLGLSDDFDLETTDENIGLVGDSGSIDTELRLNDAELEGSGLDTEETDSDTESEDDAASDLLFTDDQIEEYKKLGYNVEEYNEDGFEGFIITKENVEELTSDELTRDIAYERNGDKCSLDIILSEEDSNQIDSIKEVAGSIKDQGGFVDVVIELPVIPGENNATKVDGTTLTWDLMGEESITSIHVEYVLASSFNWALIAIIAVAVILVAIILILIFRKKVTTPPEATEAPADPEETPYTVPENTTVSEESSDNSEE